MLKIERRRGDPEVHITLGNYGRIMTPSFLKALGIAFFLHMVAAAVFQIAPLKMQATAVFPYTEVRLDLPIEHQVVLAQPADDSISSFPISEPAAYAPKWAPTASSRGQCEPEMFYSNIGERRYFFEGFPVFHD